MNKASSKARRSKTSGKAVVFILTGLLLLSGCTQTPEQQTANSDKSPAESKPQQSEQASSKPAAGGELVYALSNSPDSLDPVLGVRDVGFRVDRSLFDSLVAETADHQFKPWLAASWDVSADHKVYTFHLRKDVKFHDGTPFNAEAVKFNFDRIQNPATKSPYAISLLAPYESSEVVDDYTIRIHLKSPGVTFLSNLAKSTLGIQSPTALQKYGQLSKENPVGTGPFKFVKWVKDVQIQLERNADYQWAPETAKHKGAAYLDKVVFQIVPEDSSRVGSLQSGQASAADSIPAQNLASFQSDSAYSVVSTALPGAPYTLLLNEERPAGKDLAIRQALQAGIDVDAIVKTLYAGAYQRAWSPLSPATFGYEASLEKARKTEVAKAKQLLDTAGWTIGADGYRQKDGKRLVLNHIIQSGNKDKRGDIATLLQQQLKAIGIELTITELAPALILEKVYSGDYDIAGMSFAAGDPDILRTMYHSAFAMIKTNPAGGNAGRVKEPKLDQWLEAGLIETDSAKRAEIYSRVQTYIAEQALSIPIYVSAYTVAAKKAVSGISFDSPGYPVFYDTAIQK